MIKHLKYYLLLSVVAVTIFAACSKASKPDLFMPYAQQYLFDKQGNLSKDLLKLLDVCGVQHDGTLEGIVAATQKSWLRKPGEERWHQEELLQDKKDIIVPLFDRLGCLQEVTPLEKNYDYAVILGATVSRVRSRLAHALSLWEKGVRFKALVFLGSERPLDPIPEPTSLLLDPTANKYSYAKAGWELNGSLPTTEHEMIQFVVGQTTFPKGFDNVELVYINTPMQKAANGTLRRANTADTINEWMSKQPAAGSCLFFSNQPYVGYQDSAVRLCMPKTFTLQTVGQAAGDISVAVSLDNMARWLYQELQNKKKA